jgi:hypothetical protein
MAFGVVRSDLVRQAPHPVELAVMAPDIAKIDPDRHLELVVLRPSDAQIGVCDD